jgi:hypothetical protein
MRFTILAGALALAMCGLQEQEQVPARPLPLEVAAPAPVFRLNDHTGKVVTIGGEQERWSVLAFYPKALTPG